MEKQLLEQFPTQACEKLVQLGLREDLADRGDVTTQATIKKGDQCIATLKTKASGIFAGKSIPELVFEKHSKEKITIDWLVDEGEFVNQGAILGNFQGPTWVILECERTILNFIQRMCGIATKTYQYQKATQPYQTKILDTRKTLPGFRKLDKYAVLVGGGKNHRMGLFDQVLIKDNHITACGSVKKAVEICLENYQHEPMVLEAEVKSLEELKSIVPGPVHWVLLDNMDNKTTEEAVRWVRENQPDIKIEASGNMDEAKIKQLAPLGLDYISVGQLTHSVQALDISLLIERIP